MEASNSINMKKYALVFTRYYTVMLYEAWLELPRGCVMETSNDREYLEAEAEWRNISIQEELYEDEREYNGQGD